ncbi:hypothetical protein NBT14_05905 [Weissella paramesenteroides]|uniref:hypothetical protein n=1 Tax=Weissella paramesenteroides TaxID=1249 RepID=UPI0038578A76
MGITPNKELELHDLRHQLDTSLRNTVKHVGGQASIRLADYPSLTADEIVSEVKNSGHTVKNIDNTYLTFN